MASVIPVILVPSGVGGDSAVRAAPHRHLEKFSRADFPARSAAHERDRQLLARGCCVVGIFEEVDAERSGGGASGNATRRSRNSHPPNAKWPERLAL
jgi:hypothetical protein